MGTMLSRPTELPGHVTTGAEWKAILDELDARGVFKRGNRAANSTGATTTEIGVLRVDAIVVPANRLCLVETSGIQVFSTVAGDTIKANVRYATGGSAATTSSTLLTTNGYIERAHSGGGAGGGMITISENLPVAGSDTTYSIILTLVRNGGTGTVNLLGPIELRVVGHGSDPGDTGTDL